MEKSDQLQAASWGVEIYNVATGKIIATKNEKTSLIPASIFKLLPTGVAINQLAPNATFKTEIGYTNSISQTVLNGDLVIKGYGDPTLGSSKLKNAITYSEFFDAIVYVFETIDTLNGNIIIDNSYYESLLIPPNYPYVDIGNYYASGVGAINIHDNYYTLTYKSGAKGSSPEIISTIPDMSYLNFRSEVIAEGWRDNAYIYGTPMSDERVVRGKIPPNKNEFAIKGSIGNAAEHVLYMVRKKLDSIGVIITGKDSVSYESISKNDFFTAQSPSLKDIIRQTNYYSNNLYAEALLKRLGKWSWQMDKPGSFQNGITTITDYFNRKGINTKGLRITDGSGLSRSNLITCDQMVGYLKAMRGERYFSSFYQSLPTVGKIGTVYSLCKGEPCSGKVRAKSGTMNGILSYAGYAENSKGEMLVFCMIFNHYTGKRDDLKEKIETILNMMIL